MTFMTPGYTVCVRNLIQSSHLCASHAVASTTSDSHTRVVLGFSYAYIITLPLARLWGMVVGVVMLVAPRSSKLAPSRFAGVCLMVGLVLSLMEDIPNFVTSCNRHSQGINGK